ncbi:MAG: hypothetical protein V7636_737 [Actinomycetota bacterium]
MTDAGDLAPANRARAAKRAKAASPPSASDPSTAAPGDRFAALESVMRSLDARMEALERVTRAGQVVERIIDLDRVVAEQADALARIERSLAELDVTTIRSELSLVAERLSTLLGGPTLVELMDRIDELAPVPEPPAPPKRRRKVTKNDAGTGAKSE